MIRTKWLDGWYRASLTMFKALVVTAAMVIYAPLAAAQVAGPPAVTFSIPAELFFKPPEIYAAKLSPQGTKVAMLARVDRGRVGLYVSDVKDLSKPLQVSKFSDADISFVHWLGEQGLVFGLGDTQAAVDNYFASTGLFSIRSDGTGVRQWIPSGFGDLASTAELLRDEYFKLLHVPTDGADSVIVGKMVFGANHELAEILPLRLSLTDGTTESQARGAPDHVKTWWFVQRSSRWQRSKAMDPRQVRRAGHQKIFHCVEQGDVID